MTELFELVWQHNTGSGRTIIVAIASIGGIAALCALAHWLRYRNGEAGWLDAVRDKIRRAQEALQAPAPPPDGATPVEVPPPPQASILVELHELAEGIPERSLIGDRLQTLLRMKRARARVNVDALQQTSILKESAKWTLAFPGYAVGLMMMLGLLGTFIGLSMMVVEIQRSLPTAGVHASTAQWSNSVSSLGHILAGKKTAFSATLAGLFFSIVVSMLNFGLARAQSELYERLERFTSEDLLPATVPAFDDATPWEKLAMQLGASFEHLKELATNQMDSAEQMMAVEKSFATVVENIETITQRAATAPLRDGGEMTTVIGQLTRVNDAIIGVSERLPEILQAFRQTHQSTLSEITTAVRGQQAGMDRLSRAIQVGSNGRNTASLAYTVAGAAAVLVVLLVVIRFV